MRTIVIGDIHGGLKALIQLLERAKVTNQDLLIFLGDYVDGWSDAANVISYLLDLSQQQKCLFIKGNHDIWCEGWLKSGIANPIWLKHGGKATVNSYTSVSKAMQLKHIAFFESMPFYHISKNNDLFIHAGFTSMHGPAKEFHHSNYNWDRTLWEMAVAMNHRIEKHSAYFPKRLALFNEIYIGHTPTLNYEVFTPMHACNVWNIDTGAAFTGKLSCLDIESKQYWQSDPVMNLYPEERGRN